MRDIFTASKKIVRLLSQGCATVRSRPTLPVALEGEVQVPGFPGVRGWGDTPSPSLHESLAEALRQELAVQPGKPAEDLALKSEDVLVLSGGSDNGAFGAGLICGWSRRGDRPVFRLVSGVSTGALIGLFAFLGPTYDEQLKEAYTTISAENIFRVKNIFSILTSESLVDSEPLTELIARFVNEKMLEDIAAGHKEGRRLFAATTQLDSQRLVIWDQGAIAASGHPQALALFRKILLASSSLPGIFPPVYFEVQAGGQTYAEMHVDGATGGEALTYEHAVQPLAASLEKEPDAAPRPRRLFIIRNGRLGPEWQEVKPHPLAIMPRGLATLIKNQSVGDFYRLYYESRRDGFDYHLAIIPPDFQAKKREDFDPEYMNQLFNFGYDWAHQGYPWAKTPPHL
jgi:hypothetical protein